MEQHTGSCLCQAIRFEIDGPLDPIQICHCQQCRKAQGTPLVTNIPVATASFRLVAGADLLAEFESSPGKKRCFCRNCGSPVISRRDDRPDVVRVRAGLIDGPLNVRPVSHAWTGSRADWWDILDDLPQYPEARP
ncbi:MAG: GFA family protein [Marinobacter sp.]|nr:GFA family protein [Marinobacter sp.]